MLHGATTAVHNCNRLTPGQSQVEDPCTSIQFDLCTKWCLLVVVDAACVTQGWHRLGHLYLAGLTPAILSNQNLGGVVPVNVDSAAKRHTLLRPMVKQEDDKRKGSCRSVTDLPGPAGPAKIEFTAVNAQQSTHCSLEASRGDTPAQPEHIWRIFIHEIILQNMLAVSGS